MRTILIFAAALLCTLTYGQTTLEPFEKLSVFGNIELVLIKGDKHSYTARENREDLKIRVVEGKLKIGHRHNQRTWSDKTVVEVTFVELRSLDASAGATIEYEDQIEVSDMFVSADAGAVVYLDLNAETIEAFTGEGGTMTLKGRCRVLEAKATTGSMLKADNLEAQSVYARANTGGKLRVHAVERIEASATLGGSVTYHGDPDIVRISESTGGSVSG